MSADADRIIIVASATSMLASALADLHNLYAITFNGRVLVYDDGNPVCAGDIDVGKIINVSLVEDRYVYQPPSMRERRTRDWEKRTKGYRFR